MNIRQLNDANTMIRKLSIAVSVDSDNFLEPLLLDAILL